MPPGRQQQESNLVVTEKEVVKVEFIITTYPELRPFLEMAVLLLEGIYEKKLYSIAIHTACLLWPDSSGLLF